MVRTALIRRAVSYGTAAMMTCFGLTGVVSAQTITNTGPGSTNSITSTTTSNCTVTNNNNVSANSSNNQTAQSGNSTSDGNTTSGLPWTGWSALDPSVAQADGQGYASWWSGIINWVSQRASGDGWNSTSDNLSWTPSNTGWGAYDPMTWQANGQSFGNWYNGLQSYLNSNSSTWMLSWPADANGSGFGGTTTGSATNNYNANFSININNAARAAAGTNSCGQSNFTPPPSSGGFGAGPAMGTSPVAVGASYSPQSYGGSGTGYGTYVASGYRAPSAYHAPAPQTVPAPSAPVSSAPVAPVPSAPAPVASTPVNSISTTGPNSHNAITTTTSSNYQVTNNNNVSANSSNNQTADSGSSYSSGNTTSGGPGTGAASNGNNSGTAVGVSN